MVHTGAGRAFLRVSPCAGEDGAPVLFAGVAVVGEIRKEPDVRPLQGSAGPVSVELPDEDVHAVICRGGADKPILVEYWVERDGVRLTYCRGQSAGVVVLRRGGELLCTGFGAPPEAVQA